MAEPPPQAPPGDGRYIDQRVGMLSGEGAQQRVAARPAEAGRAGRAENLANDAAAGVWSALPSSSFAGPQATYYDRPLVKEPVWIWSVPLYFYTGGTAGAAAVLGAAAQLAGGDRALVRRCRWVAAGGTALSSLLLIHDLGRPERFLNMLRVVRPTSPMSLGSWVLAGAGAATMGSAVLAGRRGWLGRAGDAAGLGGALLGLPLAGYTAVLLANTAVPLWQSAATTLPPLFAASAVSGAASFLELLDWAAGARLAAESLEPAGRAVQNFGIAGKVADLAAMVAVEKAVNRVEVVGRPLREGLSGRLWRGAKLLTGASLALSVAAAFVASSTHRPAADGGAPAGRPVRPGRRSGKLAAPPSRRASRLRLASALLGTAGAVALRFGVFHAGKASARQPRASFQQQRERLEGQSEQ